jgi:hypothetical protein
MANETSNKPALINLPEIPDSIDNALQNLTDVPTKNVGQTFGDLWYLVFGTLSHAADKKRLKYATDLEEYRKQLAQSIEQIPEGKKIEPSIQVTAQALENSKYCVSSKELRNLFVNLISGSMNSDYERFVHPSFSEIIKQMDPLDAALLQDFKKHHKMPIVNYDLADHSHSISLDKYIYFTPELSHSYSYAASIASLERFGLLKVSFDTWLADETRYEIFQNFPYYFHLKETYENIKDNKILKVRKGLCELTPLGIHFIKVCVP